MQSEPVFEILARWEDAARSGKSISVEVLCNQQPELLADVRRKIAILNEVEQRYGLIDDQDAFSCPPTGCETSSDDSQDTDPDMLSISNRMSRWQGSEITLRMHLTVRSSCSRGGHGEIFYADDETLGRRVALKVMHAPLESDPQRRLRFMREAAIAGQLEHPGIAPVYSVGQDSAGRLCYAMRYLEGETLAEACQSLRLLEAQNKSLEAAIKLRRLLISFISVCRTIAYAHSRGVIHRDIKPLNILLGYYGEAFVLDWGLAKQLTDEARSCPQSVQAARQMPPPSCIVDDVVTLDGMIVGTPTYMSPEQTRSLDSAGIASDVYSLGATLFTILTGQPPVSEEHWHRLMERIRNGHIDSPRGLVPSISRALEAICLKSLALEPADRYQSALELADDLERYLADQAVMAFQENLWQRFIRSTRRHRVLTLSITLCLVTLSLVIALLAIVVT